MKPIDLYLKADSMSAMTIALKLAGFCQVPESLELYHPDAALDVIGTIHQDSGDTMQVDGELVSVMTEASGFHVNVRTISPELAAALDTLRTYPETPVRKWA